ncbi:MAG: efflux RND transporter periplasmic adaptor subunit [Bacteroidota bacterium]
MSVVLLSVITMGCAHHAEEKGEEVKYLVTSPLRQDTTLVREYVGQIHSIQHIEMRALERGYLQKVFVDEGKQVKKGQLMFQIMPVLYQAELQKAEAETRFAEIEYITTKRLADSNIVAVNELAKTAAMYQKAKAEVSLAQAHLTFAQIRAPFDGIMDHYYVRPGSLLNEGDLLTNLSDNSRMWVYFNVPEAEYLDYKMRKRQDSLEKVTLMMANNKQFDHPGVVETIEADFNNQTGNIAFRATFPNPENLLRHGETGNIHIAVPYKNALLIPQKATFEILDKKFVFVVDKSNVAHSREITLAAELPDLYIVKDGLTENDRILLEGLQKVRDKDKITYKYADPKQVLTTLKVYTE